MKTEHKQTGIDSTGLWTPAQYVQDMGWDFSCVEATARLGVSEADAVGLTSGQAAVLVAYCENLVGHVTGH